MSEPSRRFYAGRIAYQGAMAENYPASRGLSPETAAAWRAALAPYLDRAAPLRVLDLGSGTGRFASLLAQWFAAHVVGVEPAAAMRAVAQSAERHAAVVYVGGRAEQIPLRDHGCDAAWLSNVIHHVADRHQCARELARVLRPGGRALIAGAFAGRLEEITLFRYFPQAKQVAEQFPSIEDTVGAFAAAGFAREAVHRVRQQSCPSLTDMAARTRLRADTTLTLMPDDEFARCQAALERAAAAEVVPIPVVDGIDLLVLRCAS